MAEGIVLGRVEYWVEGVEGVEGVVVKVDFEIPSSASSGVDGAVVVAWVCVLKGVLGGDLGPRSMTWSLICPYIAGIAIFISRGWKDHDSDSDASIVILARTHFIFWSC